MKPSFKIMKGFKGDVDQSTMLEFTTPDGARTLSVEQMTNHQNMLNAQIQDLQNQEKEVAAQISAATDFVSKHQPKKPKEKEPDKDEGKEE